MTRRFKQRKTQNLWRWYWDVKLNIEPLDKKFEKIWKHSNKYF